MKTFINTATEGNDSERKALYSLLNESNSIKAEKLTKEEATKQLKPGLRLDRGWSEGGYKVLIGASKVMLADDRFDLPEWNVKASIWFPTYKLALAAANELRAI